jgi:hypothetical protein
VGHGFYEFRVLSLSGHLWFTGSPEIASPASSGLVGATHRRIGLRSLLSRSLPQSLGSLSWSHISVSQLPQTLHLTLPFGEEKKKGEEMKNEEEEVGWRRKNNKKRSSRGLLSTEEKKKKKEKKEKKRKTKMDKGRGRLWMVGRDFFLFKAPYLYKLP